MPKLCLMCSERRPRVRLICGHLAVCETCCSGLTQCPVCRHAIPLSKGIPRGYISSGSSTYHSPRSAADVTPTCFRAGCRAPPHLTYRCPTCLTSAALQYSLCHGCARDWVCPFCNRRAGDRGNADAGWSMRNEKCYACKIKDAVYKWECPSCHCGIYMLCKKCGPGFACHRCSTAASPDDLHLDSDHDSDQKSSSSSSASSASSGQPVDRPPPQVQQGRSSSSTMPP